MLFDEDLISLAARIEGHPDNVAAAWLGGFAVAVTEGERVLATSCPFPPILQLVAVVPEYDLPTKKARAALPSQYSREDAVHNLQRAAVIAAELFSGKADLRPALFDDRWHQPYRVSLVPGLAEVLRFTHHELVGLWLSGAGPSVLALVRGDAATIGGAICRILADNGVEAHPHILAADNRGAKGWSAPA
jgi:homoserine kinase